MHAVTYLLTLQIDYVILDGCGQACPGMPKEAIKTLRTQKLKEVPSWFCTYSFISVKGINWLCRFRWVWSGMHRYALEVWRYKVDFMHATSYLLKLQIDHVVSDGMVRHSQRSFWNLYISKTVGISKLILDTCL